MNEIILIVEGEKKTSCAAKDGFIVLGIGGVDCWRQNGQPLPDLDQIEWYGNNAVLFFDSDSKCNPNVERALATFAAELDRRGATVFRADPPNGPDGAKWGYDDCRANLGKRKTKKIVMEAEEVDIPPDKILVLNQRHYVAPEGPNVRIFDELSNTAYTQQDFRLYYANQYVSDESGKRKRLGDAWISHPQRRQYTQTVFDPAATPDPDIYNRYKGFNYEPSPGNWSLLHNHIVEVICSGDEENSEYLLNWLARGVQFPGERAEVAVVLHGEQGTGKGVFVNAFMSLFAPHTYHASSATEITGRFNENLKDALVVFLDEAFFAGDKAHKGTLKRLITERLISVEGKYKQRVEVPNRLKLLIASNEHWIVPAGLLERRFFVLDVSAARQQDTKYFSAIEKQLRAGGYEAFLFDLMARDIRRFDFRRCPRTKALAEQQLFSMSNVEMYWYSTLESGALPISQHTRKCLGLTSDWGHIVKQDLYEDFIERTRIRGLTHLPDISQFAIELGRLLPDGYPRTRRPRANGLRPYVWEFPPLATCKKYFQSVRGGPRA